MMEQFDCTVEQLPLHEDEWIEDGAIYFMSTYNKIARWDWYQLKECVLFGEIKYPPASFIDLDGNWYDIEDYGYKMILNDYGKGIVHPDNVKAVQKFGTVYHEFQENIVIIK